jgi:hypothetical protein
MPKLKVKHSLKLIVIENRLVLEIVKLIKAEFEGLDLTLFKNDYQFILSCMECIEREVKDKRVNKKTVLIAVFAELFKGVDSYTASDVDKLEEAITFLFENKRLRSYFDSAVRVVSSVFLKR